MKNKVVEVLQKTLEIDPKDIIEINEIFVNVFEICYEDAVYIVMNNNGANHIVDEYRRASIKDAEENIPIRFQRYFDFGHYAEDVWQSVYDIYEGIDEVLYDGETFYICSL